MDKKGSSKINFTRQINNPLLLSENKDFSKAVPLKAEAERYLTVIPRARMDSESIAYEAEGRMGY